jgi:hypothetical protein
MHVLPRVRELEERFPDILTVVGVHSGKFITERVTERIAEACDRLGVLHPVVNDRQFRVWRDYAVEAWPTVAIIDPEGYLALVEAGEFDVTEMGAAILRVAARAEARGTLVRGTDPFPSSLPRHEGPLRFPTRAVLDDGKLWVSDTGHGRVLECAWDADAATATVTREHAGLAEPRGLAALGGSMYVADRAGHSVWRLGAGTPERMAGTGAVGAGGIGRGPSDAVDLRSPWGLAAHGGRLAVSMAGTHQVWTLDPDARELRLLAGSGREDIVDGRPAGAALAQPTGLTPLAGGSLGIADCETSAVRVASSDAVVTVVGTGLFEFGDRPGTGDEALLQHCEDVAGHGEMLAVADTYNDRLQRVDPSTRACAPWPGEAGEKGALREPGGVSSHGGTLLVADTGHHRIVTVGADGSLAEIHIEGA